MSTAKAKLWDVEYIGDPASKPRKTPLYYLYMGIAGAAMTWLTGTTSRQESFEEKQSKDLSVLPKNILRNNRIAGSRWDGKSKDATAAKYIAGGTV